MMKAGFACTCVDDILRATKALSLRHSEWLPAVKAARGASAIAYRVLECPLLQTNSAGGVVDLDHIDQVIVVFCPLFLLIIRAYNHVAVLIDIETSSAQEHGRQSRFDLDSYGGLWGSLGNGRIRCGNYYNGLPMDPQQWRQSLRTLLKSDIHGLDLTKRGNEGNSYIYHHNGLWDFLQEMKSRLLAGNLTILLDSGVVPHNSEVDTQQLVEVVEQFLKDLVIA
ncbi:unnamed protein product [Parascedosporium putredinis]|uniref:Uncharacterized protein n=1 Tax=Parascedosporium putredinis TaxID=1442378 RepID=A0A9P1MAQ4_9PEZI|nr:unnamed protein product [Parascedosporium putredinis]CAI7997059.1 unnamed protein product [Parascedosporium putredinis]